MLTLLERDGELARIQAAVTRAVDGTGALVVVEGAAGIGKSALLRAAADELVSRGDVRVLRARGGELELGYAYGVVRQLFDRLLVRAGERETLLAGPAAVAAPALGMAPGADAGDPFAAFHGLYWVCANLCERGPLILVVDDAHWADRESLRWLAYLARRVDELPLLLLVGCRPRSDVSDTADQKALDALRNEPTAELLTPAPLSPSAVEAVVREKVGEARPDLVHACHEASGGNPFFVRELVDELVRRGAGAQDVDVAALSPRGITRSVLGRLDGLPSAERELADATAVLGLEVPIHYAAALAGLDALEAERAADGLADAGILKPERPLEFTHPVIRTSIYEDLPPGRRSALHGAAARRLDTDGAGVADLAAHLLVVTPSGDPWTAGKLAEAGERALGQGAPAAAARLLRRALSEPPPTAELKAKVLTTLASAEAFTGESTAAAHTLAAFESSTDPSARLKLAYDLALLLIDRPQDGEYLPTVRKALAEAPEADRWTDAGVFCQLATVLGPGSPGRRLAELRAMDEARPADAPPAPAFDAAFANVALMSGQGTRDEVLAHARAALQGGAHGPPPPETTSWYIATGTLNDLDLVDEAAASVDRALADARERGSELAFLWATVLQVWTSLARGALRDAEAAGRTLLELAKRWGEGDAKVTAARHWLGLTLVARGLLDEAEQVLDGLPGLEGPDWPLMQAVDTRSRLWIARGRYDEAAEQLLRVGELLEEEGVRSPAFWAWRGQAATALLRAGRREEAYELASDELVLARSLGVATPVGRALRIVAMTLRTEEALPLLEEAVRVLESSPAKQEYALALVDLGAAIRRHGHRQDARERLREGLEAALACGADGLVERARDELRTAGARLRRERTTGRDALTPSEVRVATLAAEGMSNRAIAQHLFLSLKTVEMHLGRVYRKLGISGRDALGPALEAQALAA